MAVLYFRGPRGTGKTTWLKHHLPDALFINLLQSEFYNRLSAHPGYLRELIPPGYRGRVIVGEVQRIPELLNEVHDLIESRKPDFVLYGPRGLPATENKRSPQLQFKQARALREFRKDYPPARCYVFYGGATTRYMEDITVLPIEYALRNLDRILMGDLN